MIRRQYDMTREPEQPVEQQEFHPEGRMQLTPTTRHDHETSQDDADLALTYIRSYHQPGVAAGPNCTDYPYSGDGAIEGG